MTDLPDGIESVMFLRDGWPLAVVCKVLTKSGYVGVGLFRTTGMLKLSPEQMDQGALLEAMAHINPFRADYSELHEHVAKLKAAAEAHGQVKQ